MVMSTEERMVETMVEAGTCVVMTCVDPGCVKVLVVIWPGSVIVDRKLVVIVLAGSVMTEVWIAPDSVMVLVVGGTTVVLVMVEKIVS